MSTAARLLPKQARRWLRSHGGPLGSVVAVGTEAPEFVLTYDDGPEPGGTDAVLPVLESRGVTATFFVLMTRVRRHPSLLADIASGGHEIALHGVDHRAVSGLPYREVLERTARAKGELEDAVGRDVQWFRPPYGAQSIASFRAVRKAGLEPVLWGPSTLDSRPASTDERLARALRGAERGAILLAHDAYAEAEDGGRGGNRPILDRGELASLVLDAYAGRGLRATSLSGALASGTATRGLWFGR